MTTPEPTPDSAALAERIAEIASGKKAIDIRVIDLRGIVSYTDFFVICSGNTERQAKAIHDGIHEELKHEGAERVRYLDMPLIQVSSSAIRRRVRDGMPLRYLVPDKVSTYIETNGLYSVKGSAKEPVAT